jgi:hypothetical protein
MCGGWRRDCCCCGYETKNGCVELEWNPSDSRYILSVLLSFFLFFFFFSAFCGFCNWFFGIFTFDLL